MTITYYILLLYLNLTKQRKKFDWKRLESKMNVFFGLYSALFLFVIGGTLFTYFVSIPVFIIFLIIATWMISELITDHMIFIYGKHKDILQKEFMSVNEESVKQAEIDAKHNKHKK